MAPFRGLELNMPPKRKTSKSNNNNNKQIKNGNGNKNDGNPYNNGTGALVNYRKANNAKVNNGGGNMMGGMLPDTKRYAVGLSNPFSDSAIGARIPDQYYAPTATLAFRDFVSLANNVSGQADVVFLPSIMCSAFSSRGSITNGANIVYRDGTNVNSACVRNNATDIYAKITSHRIVNWGIRIRNTSALTASQGIVTIALFNIPDSSIVPHSFTVGGQLGSSSSSTASTQAQYLTAIGLPINGTLLDIPSLVDLPAHMRVQATQLAERTIQVTPKLISPRAQEFRLSQDSQYGTDIVQQTSLSFIQPGSSSYIRCDGWTGIAIGYTGGSGSSGTNTFDIELVYNVEGSPNVSSGTTMIATGAKSVCDPVGMLKAQAILDMGRSFLEVGEGALAAYKSLAT